MLSGTHDYCSRSTSMDKVKYSFAEKIKQLSHFVTHPDLSNSITKNEKSVTPTLMLLKIKFGNPQMEKVPSFRKTEKHFAEIR